MSSQAGPVADLGAGAGEAVEQGGFAGVGHAHQGDAFAHGGEIGVVRMAEKSTSVLSGGEKSRLILSRMIMAEENVLALDEPTNHLDLESIEALNYALSLFDGTVIFVSHDREFVSSLATRIIEVTPGQVIDFKGTYEEYLEKEGAEFFKRAASGSMLAKNK